MNYRKQSQTSHTVLSRVRRQDETTKKQAKEDSVRNGRNKSKVTGLELAAAYEHAFFKE